jgi:hypothetical protein
MKEKLGTLFGVLFIGLGGLTAKDTDLRPTICCVGIGILIMHLTGVFKAEKDKKKTTKN